MRRYASARALGLALLVLGIAALYGMRINGDGGEYFMTTHAMYRHGSPAILPQHFVENAQLTEAMRTRIAYPSEFYRVLQERFQTPQPVSWAGFASLSTDQIYAIHFWLYSLLALPFYLLLKAAGLNPLWSLGLVNLVFAGLAFLCLRRVLDRNRILASALFLLCGTTFYLRWTGPEVMTASCALMASLFMLRGQAGYAILAAGIGATQSPSLILLAPLALGFRLLLAYKPGLIWPGAVPAQNSRANVLAGAAGLLLAALPYTYFKGVLGEFSLTGKYFTAPGLISTDRLWSLLFDLDQGMVVGVPGLLALVPVALLLAARPGHRTQVWAAALLSIATFATLAIPTLATLNWNSGGVGFMRYGYWLAMPLLALFFFTWQFLSQKQVIALGSAALAIQMIGLLAFGAVGQYSSHVRHTRLALWALDTIPAHYHPDPEIFVERGKGAETDAPQARTHTHLHVGPDGRPLKLLRHSLNKEAGTFGCAPGERIHGQAIKSVRDGWEYLHAPFTCQQISLAGEWAFGAAHAQNRRLLVGGWSVTEHGGTWSDGTLSEIRLPVAAGGKSLEVTLTGHYFATQRATEITLDGKTLGTFNLADTSFAIPGSRRNGYLTIGLRHPGAVSPLSLGESQDARKLGFHLISIRVEEIAQ